MTDPTNTGMTQSRSPTTAMVPKTIEEVARMAQFASRLYKGEERIITAKMLRGMELGIPPMSAVESLHTANIGGREVIQLSSVAYRALVFNSGQCKMFNVEHDRDDNDMPIVTVSTVRNSPHMEFSYTIDWNMVKKAKWHERKGTWAERPDVMMEHRAVAHVMRSVYADVVSGLAVEYSGEVIIDETPPIVQETETTTKPRRKKKEEIQEIQPAQEENSALNNDDEDDNDLPL